MDKQRELLEQLHKYASSSKQLDREIVLAYLEQLIEGAENNDKSKDTGVLSTNQEEESVSLDELVQERTLGSTE